MDITRVSKNGKFGYSIKEGTLWEQQRIVMEHSLCRLCSNSLDELENKDGADIYVSRKNGPLAIFAIGTREGQTPLRLDGIVWTENDAWILESFFWAKIQDYFPYVVRPEEHYLIKRGEVWIASSQKEKQESA